MIRASKFRRIQSQTRKLLFRKIRNTDKLLGFEFNLNGKILGGLSDSGSVMLTEVPHTTTETTTEVTVTTSEQPGPTDTTEVPHTTMDNEPGPTEATSEQPVLTDTTNAPKTTTRSLEPDDVKRDALEDKPWSKSALLPLMIMMGVCLLIAAVIGIRVSKKGESELPLDLEMALERKSRMSSIRSVTDV